MSEEQTMTEGDQIEALMTAEEKAGVGIEGKKPSSDEQLATVVETMAIDGFSEAELENQTDKEPFVIVQGEDGVFRKATGEELVDAGYTITDEQGNAVEVGMTETVPEPELKRLNPENAYDSEEALRAYDRETIRLLNEQQQVIDSRKSEYKELKAQAKEAKEDYEKARDKLSELVNDRKAGRGRAKRPTLFDPIPACDDSEIKPSDPGKEATDTQPELATETNVPNIEPEAKEEPVEDNSWRDVPLSALNLTQSLLDKLKDPQIKSGAAVKPIITVGDYHDYVQPLGNGWVPDIKDISGIGPKAADQIADAFAEFWAMRNRKAA